MMILKAQIEYRIFVPTCICTEPDFSKERSAFFLPADHRKTTSVLKN